MQKKNKTDYKLYDFNLDFTVFSLSYLSLVMSQV